VPLPARAAFGRIIWSLKELHIYKYKAKFYRFKVKYAKFYFGPR